ncbi:MAG: hypothetical protein AAGD38_11840 [Acidobacteriota bacterium]
MIDSLRQAKVGTLVNRWVENLVRVDVTTEGLYEPNPDTPWVQVFDRATWALMNVHRDALREYGFYLEDLYSWASHSLRRVLLDTLFQCLPRTQLGLWQRWRSLSDSRRSQLISLLVVNAHRPWLEGEVPRGDELDPVLRQLKEKKKAKKSAEEYDLISVSQALLWFCNVAIGFYLPLSRSISRAISEEEDVSPNPLTGAGWSLHSAPIHAAQAADDDKKMVPTGMLFLDPLSFANALTTVPRIAACRVLDEAPIEDVDEGKGDAFRYTSARRAKVKILAKRTSELLEGIGDAVSAGRTVENTAIKKADLEFKATAAWVAPDLSFALMADFLTSIRPIFEVDDSENPKGRVVRLETAKEVLGRIEDVVGEDLHHLMTDPRGVKGSFVERLKDRQDNVKTKIETKTADLADEEHRLLAAEKSRLERIESLFSDFRSTVDSLDGTHPGCRLFIKLMDRLWTYLDRIDEETSALIMKREYGRVRVIVDEILGKLGVDRSARQFGNIVYQLESATNQVHDDQLLLRIWTCYGFNRGRFWAAASLWRGLGLMGELIESYERWKSEIADENDDKSDIDEKEKKERETQMLEKIVNLIRGHSFRGLVSGSDLAKPKHGGTLELAFSGWNTPGQWDATWRLAKRLKNWLEHNDKRLKVSLFQLRALKKQEENSSDTDKARFVWSQCFIRRLHGGYMVGSLFSWLDAEELEHQGGQYGRRREHYWNAGIAVTSWIRVLNRYFSRVHDVRWAIETCPIVSPFLSRSAQDPFFGALCKTPYSQLALSSVNLTESATGPSKSRGKLGYSDVTRILEDYWSEGIENPAPNGLMRPMKPTGVKDLKRGDLSAYLRTQLEKDLVGTVADKPSILKTDAPPAPNPEGEKANEWDTGWESMKTALEEADAVVSSLNPSDKSKFKKEDYIRFLMASFDPRVDKFEIDEDGHSSDDDVLNEESSRYELASIIHQHIKVATHASTTSLFYQIPRVHRYEFFGFPKKTNTRADGADVPSGDDDV